jgi:hypothetical protein
LSSSTGQNDQALAISEIMSRLTPKEVAKWLETLYVNIPDVNHVNLLRDAILMRGIDGCRFDALLDSNSLCEEFRDIWPDLSPVTAVLIRKLWHTDFFPSTGLDSRRVHHHMKGVRPSPPLTLDEMTEVVEHIVDVVTPSCSLNREEIFKKINSVLPTNLSDSLEHIHRH